MKFTTIFIAYILTDKNESTTLIKIEDKNYVLDIVYKTINNAEEIKEKVNMRFDIGF